jgi:hypothetical protein
MAALVDQVYLSFGVPRPFDPEHVFVTSPFFSPLHLWLSRGLRAVYTLTVIVISIVHAGIDGSENAWFTYLTHFTYIGLSFYFIFASLHTYGYWRTGYSSLSRWPRFLQCAHTVLYSSVTVFPPIMTILYWTVLSDKTTFSTTYNAWLNISIHLINTMFVLTEVVFNSIPAQPFIHLLPLELCFLLYLPIVYITASTQGFYVFPFLNPDKPDVLAAGIIAIAFGIVAMFFVIQGTAYSKLYLLGSRGMSTGRIARRDPASYRGSDVPLNGRRSQSKYDTAVAPHLA